MDQVVRIPWAAWFGDTEFELTFPADWSVELCNPPGGRAIGEEGIRQAFANPIGTARISQLARGRHNAVIVVDDLSRPTPAWQVLPILLQELAEAGISRDRVLIIMGVAHHRPMVRQDLEKKLGPEIVRTMRVESHFAWDNLVHLGTTSRGTPVHINKNYLAADLKLVLGCLTPHGGPGFGGGAKLVVPGVAGSETIYNNHRSPAAGGPSKGLNRVDDNGTRLDMEEAARMAGLDAIVNAVVNPKREIIGLFVGDMVAAHRAGVAFARRALTTRAPVGVDVVVLNCYPKDSEFTLMPLAFNPYRSANEPLVREGGTIVVSSASSEGPGFHSLHGQPFRLGNVHSPRRDFQGRKMILFIPTINRLDLSDQMRRDPDLVLCNSWEEVRDRLETDYGANTRAAVFPVASMQLGEN